MANLGVLATKEPAFDAPGASDTCARLHAPGPGSPNCAPSKCEGALCAAVAGSKLDFTEMG